MAGLATIGHPDGTQAIVFFNTKYSTLAMSIRDATAIQGEDRKTTDTVKATYQNSDANIQGDVNNPTSLVALLMRGNDTKIIGVYGVTKETTKAKCTCCCNCKCKNVTTNSYGRLCLLSPAFQPLGDGSQKIEATHGRLAGIQKPNDNSAGWLYYRSTADENHIFRIDIEKPNDGTKVTEATEPAKESYLAAYYDAEKSARHVVYQRAGDDHKKKIYDLKDESTSDLKDIGVTNAHFPAGIAAVWVQDQKKAYVYYIAEDDGDYHLHKVVRAGDTWGKSEKITVSSSVSGTTQLSASVHSGVKKNYITFVNHHNSIDSVQHDW